MLCWRSELSVRPKRTLDAGYLPKDVGILNVELEVDCLRLLIIASLVWRHPALYEHPALTVMQKSAVGPI